MKYYNNPNHIFFLFYLTFQVVTLVVKIQEAIFVDEVVVYGLDPQGQLLQVELFDPANNSFDTLWKQGFEVSLKSSAGRNLLKIRCTMRLNDGCCVLCFHNL